MIDDILELYHGEAFQRIISQIDLEDVIKLDNLSTLSIPKDKKSQQEYFSSLGQILNRMNEQISAL
jgi:hypothetical protein